MLQTSFTLIISFHSYLFAIFIIFIAFNFYFAIEILSLYNSPILTNPTFSHSPLWRWPQLIQLDHCVHIIFFGLHFFIIVSGSFLYLVMCYVSSATRAQLKFE